MRLELMFYLVALSGLLAIGMVNVNALKNTVVGKTPEGFHRADAVELMEALCLLNEGLRCPDPYRLPNYEQQLEQETTQ